MLIASFLYSGYSDYFSGYGCIEGREHLLYAYYGRHTTLHDIIDELVEDSYTGPASEELSDISDDDVRKALLGMLNDEGRAAYESGALAECAADMDRLTECPECEAELDDVEYDCCPECDKWFHDDESPVFIIVLDYEKPEG